MCIYIYYTVTPLYCQALTNTYYILCVKLTLLELIVHTVKSMELTVGNRKSGMVFP